MDLADHLSAKSGTMRESVSSIVPSPGDFPVITSPRPIPFLIGSSLFEGSSRFTEPSDPQARLNSKPLTSRKIPTIPRWVDSGP
ncbi:hypothetical protein HNR46_003388 [Haloferula luteola]|uniref:Uncharacterized protein n=1 Tax=Haloferula luteola TaxID=595692 RepID=A0A840V539_9BACT|nr:hypothetical protein [Haloferula luteola]